MSAAVPANDARSSSGAGTGAVVVIGGYGAVGRSVAAAFAGSGRPVIVAGRHGARATALAAALGREARGVELDAGDTAGVASVIAGASAVVMCVEHGNESVARLCLDRGVSYVDVSATPAVLAAIEALDEGARRSGAAALLSVGLAPGVSNVLARHAQLVTPAAEGIDLTLCFGLAGDNGADSRRWILDGLTGRAVDARPRPAHLPTIGRRRAHPFPFSDQHTLTAALGVPVTSRLCFESRAVTSTAFALRRLGLPALARRVGATALIERLMGAVHFGSDAFVIQAEAHRRGDGSVALAVTGNGECRASGEVAAAGARLVLDGEVPPGVHHLDEIVGLGFLEELAAAGTLALHRPAAGSAR